MTVLVVGAALMDLKAHSRAPVVAGTSNPASLSTAPGGVGRNIAENLARLGTPTSLVAVVGPDGYGDQVLDSLVAAGVDPSDVMTGPHPTGTYLAVLEPDGELVMALSDVTGTEALTVSMLTASADAVAAAETLVVDTNLPEPVLRWLLDIAAGAGVPVVVEPVSVTKAVPLVPLLRADRPVHLLTPNLDELAALVGGSIAATEAGLAAAAVELHDLGVTHVWVRLGTEGSLLSSAYAGRPPVLTRTAPPPGPVVDVTGAGDAMTAGFVHAERAGATAAEAAAYGQAMAALTVASPHTVRPDLTDDLVRSRLVPTGGNR